MVIRTACLCLAIKAREQLRPIVKFQYRMVKYSKTNVAANMQLEVSR